MFSFQGFLGTKNSLKNRDMELETTQPIKESKSRKKSSKRKFYPTSKDLDNDFELPMDYM